MNRLRLPRLKALIAVVALALTMIPMLPAQPVSADSGPVDLSKFVCPDGFDAQNATFFELQSNCTEAGIGISFSLLPDGGSSVDVQTDGNGVANFGNFDPGAGTITETGASGSSRVFCSVYIQDGALGLYTEFDATGNAIGYDLADTEAIQCLWYDYSVAVLIQSEIQLQKYVCPAGYEGETATLQELDADCTDPGIGFPFALLPDGEAPQEQQTDATGHILWAPVTPGTGIITETAAENNSSRVFCSTYDLSELILANYEEYPALGNQIDYSVDLGFGLDCRWFNYGGVFPGDSTVNVFKRACPEGSWNGAGADELSLGCTEPQSGVPFAIDGDSFSSPASPTDDTGQISWQLPFGTYTISETVPPGYGGARVFCSVYPTAGGPGEFTEVDATGGVIQLVIDDGSSADCYWYNLPTELGVINLTKYVCAQGYVPANTLDQLLLDCPTAYTGVSFTVKPAAEDAVQGQTDNNGQLAFTEVPLGEGTVKEGVPSGISLVIAYCRVSDDIAQGNYQQMALTSDNSMAYVMEAGQVWDCTWFNIPAEAGPASLTINKYTCDALHDPVDPNQTLINECNLGTEDITFTLEAAGSTASASTGEGGKPATIVFSDLAAGTYLLTEQMPDNVRLAYISQCTSDVRIFSYPFSPFAVIEPDGRINVELLPGEDMVCDWYNVLAPDSGSVTITKYNCSGDVIDKSICAPGSGVDFTLTPVDGGAPISLTTDDSGVASVDVEGTFELEEVGQEWCIAESSAVNATGQIVVDPGEDVTIDIYNCNEVGQGS
jgi:hypothetical protein